jgi:hypothetical protein
MDETIRTAAISPLRESLINDMNMRRFLQATQIPRAVLDRRVANSRYLRRHR